ncbi:hypothetical protein [Roseimicrobium sp. ORNL1]|uniref:hypothetical protein n=1 Tax=Roseimicrobium sp. ORNL1 TaxID=2711231 RepID=UPI0013E12D80|nr:hypothetical protein [Roseimicrobium sp. ORNL1]QIF00628.1 hypothetical protein G5S37_03520 [Roseimicrobium sp. ORNL1]
MKSILLFFAGGVVGALAIWFGLSRNIVLVPSGTTLVEVDRFTGKARELHYSYEEANRLRMEEGERVTKFTEEWEKAHPVVQPVPNEAAPKVPESVDTGPELTAEELAQVKFVGAISGNLSPSYLNYRIFNGTSKMLTSAEVRIEGVDKETGIPIGRNLSFRLQLPAGTDESSSAPIPQGSLREASSSELKITLVKVRSAPATKAP